MKHDEVASFWAEQYEWIRTNQKMLLYAVIAIAIAFLFYRTMVGNARTRRERANILLSDAQIQLQNGLLIRDEEARTKCFSDAENYLRTILETRGKSKIAKEALYLLGNVAFYQNNFEDAEQRFRDYLDQADTPKEKAQGLIALGYTYENRFFWDQDLTNRGLLEQAEESYKQAEDLTSGTMECYMAMLGRARIYDLQPGKAEQAKELYRKIVAERKLDPSKRSMENASNFYESMLARMEAEMDVWTLAETAQIRLERLEAEN